MTDGHTTLQAVTSGVKGIAWPPLAGQATAPLLALMHQLEDTQWLSPDEIVHHQHRQLLEVATHAEKFSPHFRERLQTAGLHPSDLATPEGLSNLPVLTRRELQGAGENLFCSQLPQVHAPIAKTRSSGSTGEPVTINRTAVNQLFWLAYTLREHLWHQRDFRGKLAVIRGDVAKRTIDQADWGPPVSLLFESGPSHAIPLSTDIQQQANWLARINPDYLLIYPTNLDALLQQFEQRAMKLPGLRQVRTIGETLTAGVREATRKILSVDIADTYSSQEVGIIALQCPQSGLYHVMSESLLVEMLDERGKPCLPGQVGRMVITDLHNFATPLIRYDIGDYAETGPICSCGRGLTTLKRIVGRQRNMLRLPDGRRYWPLVGSYHYREIAPIRQYQLVQRKLDEIEVRLVTDSPLTQGQKTQLKELIHEWLGYPFQLQFVYFADQIPRSRGGKFEEFICEVE